MTPVALLDRGASSYIFDLGDGRVLKAYFQQAYTEGSVVHWAEHDMVTRFLCRREAECYAQLQGTEFEPYLPKYFGPADPADFPIGGALSSGPCVQGCGLLLERLDGTATKAAYIEPPLLAKVEGVLEGIRDTCGHICVCDASCFIPGPRAPFAVIDFAVSDDFVLVSMELAATGVLSPGIKTRLRLA